MRIYIAVLLCFSLLVAQSACHRSRSKAAGSSGKHSGNVPSSKEQKKKERNAGMDASDKAKKVIKTARGFMGSPYKYGGTSRAGFDCSGLTTISYQSVDINLPRTSQSQSTAGESVNIDDIRPGDLVFFGDTKNSKKVTHVGIVTEVHGSSAQFIHASTKLGVVENELLSGYYYPLIIKVRRVL